MSNDTSGASWRIVNPEGIDTTPIPAGHTVIRVPGASPFRQPNKLPEPGLQSEPDLLTKTTFGDIALGETFVMNGAYWQRIAETQPPIDTKLTYYFAANAALYRPDPGQPARAFQVEYIHLLDASIVERVMSPEDRVELTKTGENLYIPPQN